MVDLVIFDCDGVLVDSEVIAVLALCEVLTASGVPATASMVQRCFGMKQADILAIIASATGVVIPEGVPDQIWPATRLRFERQLKPMPGVARFLERLGDRPRCVASSSSLERIRLSLRLTGLDGFFGENVFSSQQVARGKPAPDLFLFAAERMQVPAAGAVVIEDSIYGVQGARAAGMRAIGFLGGSHIEPGHGESLATSGAEAADMSFAEIEHRLFGDALGDPSERTTETA